MGYTVRYNDPAVKRLRPKKLAVVYVRQDTTAERKLNMQSLPPFPTTSNPTDEEDWLPDPQEAPTNDPGAALADWLLSNPTPPPWRARMQDDNERVRFLYDVRAELTGRPEYSHAAPFIRSAGRSCLTVAIAFCDYLRLLIEDARQARGIVQ